MKIECILRRSGGSHITIGAAEYQFAPDAEGRHVADVSDEDHIDRLLSIPEGYRLLRSSTAPVAPVVDEVPPAAVLPAGGTIATVAETDGGETAADSTVTTEALDRDALVIEYLKHFGRKPHHKLSAQKIADELNAAGAI